jgi:hypothetical protein
MTQLTEMRIELTAVRAATEHKAEECGVLAWRTRCTQRNYNR